MTESTSGQGSKTSIIWNLRQIFNDVFDVSSSSLKTTTTTNSSSVYEFSTLSPGGSATDYDVKTTGGMFGTVTTARYVQITNTDNTNAITVKLNATDEDGITIPASGELVLDTQIDVTNIFITTTTFSGTVRVLLIGV